MIIEYKRLDEKDVEHLMLFLKDTFFDCGNIDDFWGSEDITNWLSDREDFCIGAWQDKVLIGFCLTHFHKAVKKVHLENIYVLEDFRNKDIAINMLNRVEDYYKDKGNKIRFVALIKKENIPALNLIKKKNYSIGDEMFWVQKNE